MGFRYSARRRNPVCCPKIGGMKAVKKFTRTVSKAIAGLAVLVFLRAPFTDTGWVLMGAAVIIGLICLAGYLWSEPDVEPAPEEDSK